MEAQHLSHKIAVFGSTGSIGTQSLNILEKHKDKYQVFALVANQNIELLFDQCLKFHPSYAAVNDTTKAAELRGKLHDAQLNTEVLTGADEIAMLASNSDYDTIIAGITGGAGLQSTYNAARSGKRILLANKESIVMAGSLILAQAQKNNSKIIPIDSEHNAIFQCLNLAKTECHHDEVNPADSLILTASGGPFLHTDLTALSRVTPEQACQHPKWDMGKKISVDSATLMNKGFEIIEAHWLFSFASECIEVIIHPQSIVHGMVKLRDGSVLAQMAEPDMRIPISTALAWPSRIDSGVLGVDFLKHSQLEFLPVDEKRFPCVQLAYDVMKEDSSAAITLNAANEVAVQAFLDGQISFTDIYNVNKMALETYNMVPIKTIEDILSADEEVRIHAKQLLRSL